MSENGEIYTAGKNFTLPPALTRHGQIPPLGEYPPFPLRVFWKNDFPLRGQGGGEYPLNGKNPLSNFWQRPLMSFTQKRWRGYPVCSMSRYLSWWRTTNGDSHCLCLLFRPHFPQKYIAHSLHHGDESTEYDYACRRRSSSKYRSVHGSIMAGRHVNTERQSRQLSSHSDSSRLPPWFHRGKRPLTSILTTLSIIKWTG